MYIISFFTNNGTPATGLNPSLIAVDVSDNSVVLNSVTMAEIGYGGYKYDFSAYDKTKDYFYRSDGGATLSGNDRYLWGSNENNQIDENVTIIKTIETKRWKIINNQLILYDTDNTTPLYTFDLKDSAGDPTETNPYERMPA